MTDDKISFSLKMQETVSRKGGDVGTRPSRSAVFKLAQSIIGVGKQQVWCSD